MPRARLALIAVFPLVAIVGACSPPEPAKAPPAPETRVAAATPRCAPNEPTQPNDLREVMKKGGADVKGCFLLGKSTSTPESMRVSLRVSPAGAITSLSSQAPGAERTQTSCAEDIIKKLSFSRFCGEEVEIAWTYSLGGS